LRLDETENLVVVVAAQKLVALDGGNDAHGRFVARFGALNPAEATDANWSGQSDLVRKRQEDFNGGAFLDVLSQVKVDPAGANVAGFGAGFSNGGPGSPTNSKGEPHGEALSCAAFRPGQEKTSSIEGPVYLGWGVGTIGQEIQKEPRQTKYGGTRKEKEARRSVRGFGEGDWDESSSRLGIVWVHPGVFAKSAEAIEKQGDELPRTAPLTQYVRGKEERRREQKSEREIARVREPPPPVFS
jgi:hypothetical protein